MYCFHSCLWNKLDCNYLDNCVSLHWNYMISVEVWELTVEELIIFLWHSILRKGAFQHEIITGLSVFNKSRKRHVRLRRIETVKQTLKKEIKQFVFPLHHSSSSVLDKASVSQRGRTYQHSNSWGLKWLYGPTGERRVKAAGVGAVYYTTSPCL